MQSTFRKLRPTTFLEGWSVSCDSWVERVNWRWVGLPSPFWAGLTLQCCIRALPKVFSSVLLLQGQPWRIDTQEMVFSPRGSATCSLSLLSSPWKIFDVRLLRPNLTLSLHLLLKTTCGIKQETVFTSLGYGHQNTKNEERRSHQNIQPRCQEHKPVLAVPRIPDAKLHELRRWRDPSLFGSDRTCAGLACALCALWANHAISHTVLALNVALHSRRHGHHLGAPPMTQDGETLAQQQDTNNGRRAWTLPCAHMCLMLVVVFVVKLVACGKMFVNVRDQTRNRFHFSGLWPWSGAWTSPFLGL